MTPTLAALWTYPIKGCRGISTTEVKLDQFGIQGDRRYLIVNEQGAQITQRSHPKLVFIAPTVESDGLLVTLPESRFRVTPRGPEARLVRATVWSDAELRTEDCGDEASGVLSDFLGERVRLVYAGHDYVRRVKPSKAPLGDQLSFADAYPLLVMTTASLRDLNDRLAFKGDESLPVNRFRPNLVFEASTAFEEDGWGRFQVGETVFRCAGPCGRCIVTTTDQETGERSHEPLRTLSGYRRDREKPSEVNFGQNVIHETKNGLLSVGMKVSFLGAA